MFQSCLLLLLKQRLKLRGSFTLKLFQSTLQSHEFQVFIKSRVNPLRRLPRLGGGPVSSNTSHMALCKGFCVMLGPIRATRSRRRVARLLGNSLAAAILGSREIRVSCRTW